MVRALSLIHISGGSGVVRFDGRRRPAGVYGGQRAPGRGGDPQISRHSDPVSYTHLFFGFALFHAAGDLVGVVALFESLAPVYTSRFDKGSSIRNTLGLRTIARPMATPVSYTHLRLMVMRLSAAVSTADRAKN